MSRTYEQLEPVISALDERIKTNLGAFPTDTVEGSIVSFPDGADDIPLKSLVVNIDPVQDLHGYDGSWPAGGGKNKIPYPYYSQAGTFDGVTYTIGDDGKLTATGTTERGTNFFFARNVALTAGTYTASIIGDFAGPIFMIYDQVNKLAICNISPAESVHYKTFTIESDMTVNIYLNTSHTGLTFNISAYFQLEQGSTATAYAPYAYENICPISGWTGCNVKHWGKNWIENASDTYSLTAYQFAKYTPSASLKDITSGTISVSANVPSGQTLKLFSYDGRDNDSVGTFVRQSDGRYSVTINSTDFKNTIEFRIYSQPYTSGSSVVTEISDATFVVNNTATEYEPYTGQTISINWESEAGTVYGGKLDVLSGVLTVDRAMVDLGTLTWDYNTNYTRFSATVGDIKSTSSNYTVANNLICSQYTPTYANKTAAESGNNMVAIGTGTSVFVRDESYTDAASFKSAMDGVQLVYELATPLTIQLTPHDVKTLLGQNNIFADTGDTEVEYRADTKLYIERLTEPDADMIADANITSGSYFMVGNTLYKATANIASGSAVIEGTNAIRKSLSEALNEINS